LDSPILSGFFTLHFHLISLALADARTRHVFRPIQIPISIHCHAPDARNVAGIRQAPIAATDVRRRSGSGRIHRIRFR